MRTGGLALVTGKPGQSVRLFDTDIDVHRFFFKGFGVIFPEPIHRQFLLFAAVGAGSTLAHYALMIYMVNRFGSNPIIATCWGFLLGAVISYWLNYHLTFGSTNSHPRTLVKFGLSALIGFSANTLIVKVGVQSFELYYMVAQFISTVAVLFFNFTLNRLWTFNEE